MSRELPAELAVAIEQPVVRPFLAYRLEVPDPVTVWTGTGTIRFDDSDGVERDWLGATPLLYSIDSVGEATDGSATGLKATLFQIPPEFADDIADQATKGVLGEAYVGALNETFQTVEAVKLLFKGRLDDYRVTDGGDSLNVETTLESRSIDQRRPSIKKFTNEYQQRRYPGDLLFEYLPQMTEISVIWAKGEAQGASLGGGGSATRGDNLLRPAIRDV